MVVSGHLFLHSFNKVLTQHFKLGEFFSALTGVSHHLNSSPFWSVCFILVAWLFSAQLFSDKCHPDFETLSYTVKFTRLMAARCPFLWLQNKPKSSSPDHRVWLLKCHVCQCLYGQTSSLWSHLFNGRCSRCLVVHSDPALQTKVMHF